MTLCKDAVHKIHALPLTTSLKKGGIYPAVTRYFDFFEEFI